MQHSYTVIYQYENPRSDHQVDFDDLNKAKADIEWAGKAPVSQTAAPAKAFDTSIS